jgi:Tfp pilus assembly protein PilN
VLKINLLPKSFAEKKRVRALMFVMAIVLIGVVAGLFYIKSQRDAELARLQTEIDNLADEGQQVDRLNSEISAINGEIAFTKSKVDFVNAVRQHNLRWTQRYALINKWTYERVQYTNISTAGDTAVMTCLTDSLDSVARYYLNMIQNCEKNGKFLSVSLSDITFEYPRSSGSANLGNIAGDMVPPNAYTFTTTIKFLPTDNIAAPTYPVSGAPPPSGGAGSSGSGPGGAVAAPGAGAKGGPSAAGGGE